MKTGLWFGPGLAMLALLAAGCSGGKSSGNTGAVGGTGNISDDATITKAVQQQIDSDPDVKGQNITFKVGGGQVDLEGSMKTIANKDKAEADVDKAIQGFSRVNAGVIDNITIEETGSKERRNHSFEEDAAGSSG